MKPGVGLAAVLLLGAALRVPFWLEAWRTPLDGDTAIVGLMARHLGESATLWGQPYGSPLEAWLAAPLLALLGWTPEVLRAVYFILGLALVPVAYALGRALHPAAGLPAALLLACPSPYLFLLAALPPPLYPSTLLVCGLLLWLALHVRGRWATGARDGWVLVAWGTLAGLALWTHLSAAPVVAAAGGFLLWGAPRGRRVRRLGLAAAALIAASAPAWQPLVQGGGVSSVIRPANRRESFRAHLSDLLPQLHRPVGGLLGTHVPLVADDATHVLTSPWPVRVGLPLAFGLALLWAAAAARQRAAVAMLLAATVLVMVAFLAPARAGPHSIRFLSPAYLPLAALLAAAAVHVLGARGALAAALAVAGLNAAGAAGLLEAWRGSERADAPFRLPDLAAVRAVLERHGVTHAYASYGPAYRLTFETRERIIVSQPWNERFRHHPLPYLDEVRFAKNVAWVLTPDVPSDLPTPRAFEDALGAASGRWQRLDVPPAVIYLRFSPPFPPEVQPWPGLDELGDGNLETRRTGEPSRPLTLPLVPPRKLSAVTLLSGPHPPTLPRSLDVEVSADGQTFEVVARRRRRGERADLRWVNGHPGYVLDHDVLSVPLDGRLVAALRLTPVTSIQPWALAEVLLHPQREPGRAQAWTEWLDPRLDWNQRVEALKGRPRPTRQDWFYRVQLAERRARR